MITTTLCYSATSGSVVADCGKPCRLDMGNVGYNACLHRCLNAVVTANDPVTISSFAVGSGYLNLIAQPRGTERSLWGRVIFYVSDVDAFYRHVVAHGLQPETTPHDAEWRERYFHIVDPAGHELSFAKPLS